MSQMPAVKAQRARENRAYVRMLLSERQPAFAAALACVPRNSARLEVPVAGLSWGNGRVAGRGACL